MNKPYFTKYLPVQGEIREGDIALYEAFGFGAVDFRHGSLHYTSFPKPGTVTMPVGSLDDKRPYKLFLCSRDIQVGDKVYGREEKVIDAGLCLALDCPDVYEAITSDHFKVIGEISPDALSYVKEGDEFDEEQVELWIKAEQWQTGDEFAEEYGPDEEEWKTFKVGEVAPNYGYIISKFVYIKGPCGHFH